MGYWVLKSRDKQVAWAYVHAGAVPETRSYADFASAKT